MVKDRAGVAEAAVPIHRKHLYNQNTIKSLGVNPVTGAVAKKEPRRSGAKFFEQMLTVTGVTGQPLHF